MSDAGPTKIVKALHKFVGDNNDELCFNKGDLITVTQAVEGGWWEGTLDSKTGWFPSNHVKEVKDGRAAGVKTGPVAVKAADVASRRESKLFYRNVVLQSLIDTERPLVNDLQAFLQDFLRPLQAANILTPAEYSCLVGNIEDIACLHQNLLTQLDECAKLPIHQQKIGAVFMEQAPQLQSLYQSYCANHPRAVAVLQKQRDELEKFMESRGVTTGGVMTLTTSLSKPLTRLDKYSSLLKELERHTEEGHADRGDTQRAISVYRDIATSCTATRKLKELEYEIMSSTIIGWEGEEISEFGEVLLLSHVSVHSENGEKKDRLFLLFPAVLVMLSISSRMSGYVYEGKLPVSGMSLNELEDNEHYMNAFEVTGSMIDRRVVSCSSANERQQWVDKLRLQAKQGPAYVSTKPQSLQISTSQPSICHLSKAKTAQVSHQPYRPFRMLWTLSCLRPSPPLRPSVFVKDDVTRSPRTGRRRKERKPERAYSEDDYVFYKRIDDSKTLEDDALILRVIEAYCTSAKTRQTVNSLDLSKIRLTQQELLRDGMFSVSLTDPLISPSDVEDYAVARSGKVLKGICCSSVPVTKTLIKSLKRL